jgi:hypothetical protein
VPLAAVSMQKKPHAKVAKARKDTGSQRGPQPGTRLHRLFTWKQQFNFTEANEGNEAGGRWTVCSDGSALSPCR